MEVAAIDAQNDKERREFEEQMEMLALQIEKDRMRKDVLSPSDKRGDMTVDQEKNLKRNVTRRYWCCFCACYLFSLLLIYSLLLILLSSSYLNLFSSYDYSIWFSMYFIIDRKPGFIATE